MMGYNKDFQLPPVEFASVRSYRTFPEDFGTKCTRHSVHSWILVSSRSSTINATVAWQDHSLTELRINLPLVIDATQSWNKFGVIISDELHCIFSSYHT